MRTEDADDPDGASCIFIHDKQLKELVGEGCYIKKSELSHDLLFKYFVSTGGGVEVKPFDVVVQTLGGITFELKMDNVVRRTVGDLKEAIEQHEGTSRHLQELFLLNDSNAEVEDGGRNVIDSSKTAMNDRCMVENPCTVVLCVKEENRFCGWDTTSPLVGNGIFNISGRNNSIASQIYGEYNNYQNCMFVDGLAMEECTGKHRVSVMVLGSARDQLCVILGVAPADSEWDKDPFTFEQRGSGMCLSNGSLYGNGKENSTAPGDVQVGQIVTMELDTDAHTLKFWVDGKPHGPGYTSGVVGSLRWALSSGFANNAEAVQLVPDIVLAE